MVHNESKNLALRARTNVALFYSVLAAHYTQYTVSCQFVAETCICQVLSSRRLQEMTSRDPRLQPISVVVVRHVSGTCWSACSAVWRRPSVGVGWPPRRCVWSSWFWVVGWRATCAAGRHSADTVPPALPPRRRRRTDDRGCRRTMPWGSTRRELAAALNDLHSCTNNTHIISVCYAKGSKYNGYLQTRHQHHHDHHHIFCS